MAKGIIIGVIVVLLILGGVYFYMSSGTDTSTGTGTEENVQETPASKTEGATGKTYTVDIKSFKFNPASLTIDAGDTIIWTNSDSAAHTATADNGEFDSDRLETGDTFSYTFTKPGTYSYICSIHPSMKGSIVVRQ